VDKVFHWNNSVISYCIYGTGKKAIIAFHGFGQTKEIFKELSSVFGPDYQVIAVDLPYHGATIWRGSETIDDSQLLELTTDFLSHLELQDKISLLGYSIGGNYALAMSLAFPTRVHHLWLLAADGLKFKLGFWFITHTLLGKWLFKGFVVFPQPAMLTLQLLGWLRIYPKKLKTFFMNSISSKEKRIAIYKRWRSVSRMKINPKPVSDVLNKNEIHVDLVFGRYDKIIPLRNAVRFNDKLRSSNLLILEQGHQLLNAETYGKMKDIYD
jgi:pimeloyl-ACP methyl ester carboxylesterase